MTKKLYTQPTLGIMPFGMMVALCVSGETPESVGGGEQGANPWIGGRVPPRTPKF